MAPKNFRELEKMLEFAVNLNEPAVIRYPRGDVEANDGAIQNKIVLGKSELLKPGKDVSIIAIGKMVEKASAVSRMLAKENIDAEIINVRFLKPLDKELILKSIRKTKRAVTIEDNLLTGGLGTAITKLVNEENGLNVKIKTFGYNDVFVQHGKPEELEKIHGLDAEAIANNVKFKI